MGLEDGRFKVITNLGIGRNLRDRNTRARAHTHTHTHTDWVVCWNHTVLRLWLSGRRDATPLHPSESRAPVPSNECHTPGCKTYIPAAINCLVVDRVTCARPCLSKTSNASATDGWLRDPNSAFLPNVNLEAMVVDGRS